MLTKAKSAHDVMFVHLLLDQLEKKLELPHRIGIECLIEEVEGMMNVDEIAACSDRLECLIFGMGDYSASQQMQVHVGRRIGALPRRRLALPALQDDDRVPRERHRSGRRSVRELPQSGQLSAAKPSARTRSAWSASGRFIRARSRSPNRCSRPRPTPSPCARKQKAAYAEALAQGLGAINVDGVMVDAASIRIVQNLIDRADLYGM